MSASTDQLHLLILKALDTRRPYHIVAVAMTKLTLLSKAEAV